MVVEASTLKELEVVLKEGRKVNFLLMSEIITDLKDFNCRGKVDPRDCIELAEQIRTQGLLSQVIVRPYIDEVNYPGKKYHLVAGYRRFMAHIILRRTEIEAEVVFGLTEATAAILNLTENIERKDLNLMQEARAFGRLHARFGYSPKDIAQHLDRSPTWVDVRLKALDLEPEIQKEIEKGMLTQNQVKDIHTLPPGDARFAAVRQIKTAKLRGDKRKVYVGAKKPRNVHSKKRREVVEIFEMQDHMLEEFGNGSFTRCPVQIQRFIRMLGWTAGEATDIEVFTTLRQVAEENKMHYDLPEDALDFIKSGQ